MTTARATSAISLRFMSPQRHWPQPLPPCGHPRRHITKGGPRRVGSASNGCPPLHGKRRPRGPVEVACAHVRRRWPPDGTSRGGDHRPESAEKRERPATTASRCGGAGGDALCGGRRRGSSADRSSHLPKEHVGLRLRFADGTSARALSGDGRRPVATGPSLPTRRRLPPACPPGPLASALPVGVHLEHAIVRGVPGVRLQAVARP